MVDIVNPLDETHLAQIKEALVQIKLGEVTTKKAVAAGIDISDRLEVFAEQRKQLLAIKTQFFPGQ